MPSTNQIHDLCGISIRKTGKDILSFVPVSRVIEKVSKGFISPCLQLSSVRPGRYPAPASDPIAFPAGNDWISTVQGDNLVPAFQIKQTPHSFSISDPWKTDSKGTSWYREIRLCKLLPGLIVFG